MFVQKSNLSFVLFVFILGTLFGFCVGWYAGIQKGLNVMSDYNVLVDSLCTEILELTQNF